jgi:hypothetical protein
MKKIIISIFSLCLLLTACHQSTTIKPGVPSQYTLTKAQLLDKIKGE